MAAGRSADGAVGANGPRTGRHKEGQTTVRRPWRDGASKAKLPDLGAFQLTRDGPAPSGLPTPPLTTRGVRGGAWAAPAALQWQAPARKRLGDGQRQGARRAQRGGAARITHASPTRSDSRGHDRTRAAHRGPGAGLAALTRSPAALPDSQRTYPPLLSHLPATYTMSSSTTSALDRRFSTAKKAEVRGCFKDTRPVKDVKVERIEADAGEGVGAGATSPLRWRFTGPTGEVFQLDDDECLDASTHFTDQGREGALIKAAFARLKGKAGNLAFAGASAEDALARFRKVVAHAAPGASTDAVNGMLKGAYDYSAASLPALKVVVMFTASGDYSELSLSFSLGLSGDDVAELHSIIDYVRPVGALFGGGGGSMGPAGGKPSASSASCDALKGVTDAQIQKLCYDPNITKVSLNSTVRKAIIDAGAWSRRCCRHRRRHRRRLCCRCPCVPLPLPSCLARRPPIPLAS